MSLTDAIGAGFRDKDSLISTVSRHLLKRSVVDDYAVRGASAIHPSEIANEHWCHRATYYRLSGAVPDPVPRWIAMESVFETGHEAHHKWQTWFREMGLLRGMWQCNWCLLKWESETPYECPRCESGPDLIEYAEVPVSSEDYLIAGQMDGDVLTPSGWVPIEIKTIGPGTVRYDAPGLVKRHTYTHVGEDGVKRTGVDWPGLWHGIRRPFPAHLRQGMVYLFCTGRTKIVYLYEPKFITAQPKEFEIGFNKNLIADALAGCLSVKDSLERGRPPKRPMWAEPGATACKRCVFRTTCWGERLND